MKPNGAALTAVLGATGAVWCASDDTATFDRLADNLREHPREGLAVADAVSQRLEATRSEGTLATAVARALGIGVDVQGKLGVAHTMTGLVPHLICGPWQHLLVPSANWCHWRAVAALTDACRAAGVTAWLVTTSELSDEEHTFYTQVSDTSDQAGIAQTLLALPCVAPPAEEVSGWEEIRVPTSDFVTFLADVDDQLPRDQVLVVEAELRAEHSLALTWFAQHAKPDPEVLAERLRQRWDECGTVGQYLTRLRGWQIAAFGSGQLLKVDLENLIGAVSAVPSAAARTPGVWARLNAWWEPGRAAACALVAAGMGSEDACEVTLGQVSADGAKIAGEIAEYRVEEGARVHVRRARLARLLDGAGDKDPLLVTLRGRPADWRWVAKAVDDARRIHDIALSNGTTYRRAVKPDRWAQRHGLLLMELP